MLFSLTKYIIILYINTMETHSSSPVLVSCKNCKKNFTMGTDDFNYYEKVTVPPPTWCPGSGLIRRWPFKNPWTKFRRNCDVANRRTMSIYPPKHKFNVICHTCWCQL